MLVFGVVCVEVAFNGIFHPLCCEVEEVNVVPPARRKLEPKRDLVANG